MPVTAREAALKVLTFYRTRGARPDIILENMTGPGGLDSRDMGLANNIINGVLQNRALCDYYIEYYSGRKLDYFEPAILDIMRISVYQLLFLTRVPPHAVVSEGVTLAKKNSKNASGLVNAVLRKISDNRQHLPSIETATREAYLAIRYSHPEWLVRELLDTYGEEKIEAILQSDNTPAPMTVITNTLRCDTEALKAALERDGVVCEPHPYLSNALNISGSGLVTDLEAFQKGWFYVQDAAAFLAVQAAAPKKGDTVCDVCSAPGGKSFAAAILMENSGQIHAGDIHEKKLRLIKSGAERLGITIIETQPRDGREVNEALADACDVVLCDVPCSGFGVMRKKPEIRYKDPAELERLPEIQLGILKASARCVKPGGTLLYSTCTLLKRENEDVVSAFLNENDDFSLAAFELPAPLGKADGMATLLPDAGNTDGFFICKMVRKQKK